MTDQLRPSSLMRPTFIVRAQPKAALGQHNSFQQTEEIKEGGGRNFLNFKYISFYLQCNVDVELVRAAGFSESSGGLDSHGQRQQRCHWMALEEDQHACVKLSVSKEAVILTWGACDLRGAMMWIIQCQMGGRERDKERKREGGREGSNNWATYSLFAGMIPPLEKQNQLLPHDLVAETERVSEWVSEWRLFPFNSLQQFASEGKAPQKTSPGLPLLCVIKPL